MHTRVRTYSKGRTMKDISRNLTMLCDFYELTMSNGYFKCGIKDKIVYFDVFYKDSGTPWLDGGCRDYTVTKNDDGTIQW